MLTIILEIIFALVTGMIAGSYAAQCIIKLPEGGSYKLHKFHCDSCGQELRFIDIVPIASYVMLNGRCRYCNEKIKPLYPVIEILNCLIYLAIIGIEGFSIQSILKCLLMTALVVISIIDIKHKIIPNECNSAIFAIGIIYTLTDKPNVISHLLGLVVTLLLVGGLYIITKGKGIGGGDVKMIIACGLLLGVERVTITLAVACATALIAQPFVALAQRNTDPTQKKYIPFGPFLSIGIVVSVYFGTMILTKYNLFYDQILSFFEFF